MVFDFVSFILLPTLNDVGCKVCGLQVKDKSKVVSSTIQVVCSTLVHLVVWSRVHLYT